MMTFFRSTSGTYYYGEFPVDYPAGYTVVSQEEYNAWCVQMGLLDLVVE